MSGAPIPASRDALAVVSGERRRPTTVSDYHRMVSAGILGEDDRVELIEGVILEASPQSELHAQVIQRLDRLLYRSLFDKLAIRCQLPLRLGDRSEPEPDFAVLRAEDARSHREPPSRAGRSRSAATPDPTAAIGRSQSSRPPAKRCRRSFRPFEFR